MKVKPTLEGNYAIDHMLLMMSIERKPTIVEIEIMGLNLTNTIMDRGVGVNVLLEDT